MTKIIIHGTGSADIQTVTVCTCQVG